MSKIVVLEGVITTAFRIAYQLSIQKNEQISNERSTLKGGKGARSGEVSFAPNFNFSLFSECLFLGPLPILQHWIAPRSNPMH